MLSDSAARGSHPDPRADAQDPAGLRLVDWRPRPQLVVPVTEVATPSVTCIDAHNHLGRWLSADGDWIIRDVDALLTLMDDHHVEAVVNLDGRWGAELDANVARYDRAHPGRFVTFAHLDWRVLADPSARDGGGAALLDQVRDAARRGARGLKVWKDLGLEVRDASGALVMPDDPRVVAALELAGELGLAVLIHVADPKAFFEPLDRFNERYDELLGSPDWSFADRDRFPAFDTLLDALEALCVATPGTRYIGAHVGCVAEDLDRVERLLDAAPNVVVDIAGRIAELGRQPRRFRRLVQAYPDRVVFGTDAYPLDATALRTAFRFLETEDESFDYAPGDEVPPQGRWQVSGAGLPAELLPAVYAGTARRVLGL